MRWREEREGRMDDEGECRKEKGKGKGWSCSISFWSCCFSNSLFPAAPETPTFEPAPAPAPNADADADADDKKARTSPESAPSNKSGTST